MRTAIINSHISRMRRRRVLKIFTRLLPERGDEEATGEVDDRDLLRRALAELAPRTRAVVVLRHYMGLTEQEAANTLGCSTGNVNRLANRGLKQLRLALGDEPQAVASADCPVVDRSRQLTQRRAR
ncbi:hypothetical protein GCM10010211_71770 [Streptomyces albospinus]|uniref:RNA polymerase sigma factor 70 region 4 type 2 domain-containing protein n=1 Tax=Streptomyces albospinus TaxID=285515 RepID=A0ABQ2VN63_9ACTN|nr:hypothetical protein GCM10010211_71770 [Streptomyces albospinus]